MRGQSGPRGGQYAGPFFVFNTLATFLFMNYSLVFCCCLESLYKVIENNRQNHLEKRYPCSNLRLLSYLIWSCMEGSIEIDQFCFVLRIMKHIMI